MRRQTRVDRFAQGSRTELIELKKSGKATMQNAIWLARMELFKKVGPEMLKDK
jgi:hypothetical protein